MCLVYNVKSKQKALLGVKETLRSAVAYLRCAELCPQPRGLPGQLQALYVGQTTVNPLNTLWVRVLFSWRGKGKGGWCFGLVSAAVCGEPQMISVDGRAGCGFSVQGWFLRH